MAGKPMGTGCWTLDDGGAPLRQCMGRLVIGSSGQGFVPIGHHVNAWLEENAACDGLVTLFLRHTSASLTVQENTDPDVQADILDALHRLVPEDIRYRHHLEGLDDMPAHIKTVLTGVSLPIPVIGGALDLGTWQALYMVEHRKNAHQRTLTLHYAGS